MIHRRDKTTTNTAHTTTNIVGNYIRVIVIVFLHPPIPCQTERTKTKKKCAGPRSAHISARATRMIHDERSGGSAKGWHNTAPGCTAEWCCMYTLTSRAHGTQLAVGIALTHRHSNVTALEAHNARAPRPNQQTNGMEGSRGRRFDRCNGNDAPLGPVAGGMATHRQSRRCEEGHSQRRARRRLVAAMSYQSSQMQACVWLQQSGLGQLPNTSVRNAWLSGIVIAAVTEVVTRRRRGRRSRRDVHAHLRSCARQGHAHM